MMQLNALVLALTAALALPVTLMAVRPGKDEHGRRNLTSPTGRQPEASIRHLPAGTVTGLALCGLAMSWLAWLGFLRGDISLPAIAAAVIAADCFAAMAYARWLGFKTTRDAGQANFGNAQDPGHSTDEYR